MLRWATPVRRTCDGCGFENAEPEKACPLCGSSAAAAAALDVENPTLQFPATRRIGEPEPAAAPGAASALGRVFAGRYVVQGLLGSGGMGQVYRVLDNQENCARALKILHPGEEQDGAGSGRFRREATILAKLQHPAVPRILDTGTADGQLFIVTELIEGRDLKLD